MIGRTTSFPLSTIVAALAATYIFFRLLSWRRRVAKLPPGPKKLPVIENLLDVPAKLDSELFAKMGKHYDSDIIHLGAMGQSIVVLNSVKAARELLFKRSGTYSGRPESFMIQEICGWDYTLGLFQYGEKWREQRRAFTKYMGVDAKIHYPNELYHARKMLSSLLDTPDKVVDHLRHMVGAIIISTAYGIKVRSQDDPYVRLVEAGGRMLSALALEGPFLPDIWRVTRHLPSWIPGVKFKKIAERHRPMAAKVRGVPFEAAQDLMKSGQSLPSFVSLGLENIEQKESDAVSIDSLKDVAAQIFIAGADTVYSTLVALVLALVKYPEVQQRAQDELDRALGGSGKFPEHDEIMELPYLTAMAMELTRWKPVTPLGVPHAVTADDVYEGYFIPKGSTVIANQAAMLHNEEDFPNPDQFIPERFLKDGKINMDIPNPMDIAFGFGRRICPGRHIAHSTIMITAATMISNLQFSKKKDSKGRIIEPVDGYMDGIARTPLPFECSITPRTKAAENAIRVWSASEE